MRIVVAVVLGAFGISPAWAQFFFLTDGDFTYGYATRGTLLQSNSLALNNLFRDSWFYRATNELAETELLISDLQATADNVAVGTDTLSGFSVLQFFQLSDLGDGRVQLTQSVTITNTTPSPLDISLYHYVDLDVSSPLSFNTDDIAQLVPGDPYSVLFADGDGGQFSVIGQNADAFQVTAFETLLDSLRDGSVTTLDNSGTPFGPGDATVALQWNRTISAGNSATVTSVIGIGDLITVIPEPNSLALMALATVMIRPGRQRERGEA